MPTQALFIVLTICCMIGTANGVGHTNIQFAEFANTEVFVRALMVSHHDVEQNGTISLIVTKFAFFFFKVVVA